MIHNKVELYSTGRGIVMIDDVVKMRIMHALIESNMSFDEIVQLVGKAKSTTSVHLEKLEEDGLISSIHDPDDTRKKIYRNKAYLLGETGESTPVLTKQIFEDIKTTPLTSFDFIHSLFKSLHYTFDSLGLNAEPLLRLMGERIGYEISKKMTSGNIEDLLGEIGQFRKENNLGMLEVLQKTPLTIKITECYICSGMPEVGKTLCSLDEGILKAIIDYRLNVNTEVEEIECFGTGHKHCKYSVQIK